MPWFSMVGRPNHGPVVTSLPGVESRGLGDWWRRRRARATPPPRDEREWVHPSELPSFEKLRTHQIWPIKSPAARAVAALMAVALVVGSAATVPHAVEQSARDAAPRPVHQPAPVELARRPRPTRWTSRSPRPATSTSSPPWCLPHNLAVTTTRSRPTRTSPVRRRATSTSPSTGSVATR